MTAGCRIGSVFKHTRCERKINAYCGSYLKAVATLTEALADLDQGFAALTGHTLNLRTLFSLSLAGIGAWRIWEQGLMLEMVPGWLMVWLAFDAFIKLHPPTPPTRASEAGGSPR